MAHLVGRRELHAVSRCPAIHLALCAAAEPQQFRPEFFDEVEQACNRGLLLLVGAAERQTRDMNMQAASACVRIGDIQQLIGVIMVGAAAVDFEFYPEVPQTFTVMSILTVPIFFVAVLP